MQNVSLANKIKAMTLFATHYFELTQLPEKMEGVANVHLLDHLFWYTCQRRNGQAIALARRAILHRVHKGDGELESLSPNAAATQIDGTQMSLLAPAEETSPAVEALEAKPPPDKTDRRKLNQTLQPVNPLQRLTRRQ
jgi:DNA mismatch repair protein MutS